MTTVADALRLQALDAMLAGYVAKLTVSSYEDFVNGLYDQIQRCIGSLENHKHIIENESEDATTTRIIMFLEGAGFKARQQTAAGNVDIYIENLEHGYKWIGEAKKYDSVTSIAEGFKQLTTRYSVGADKSGKGYGALIGYLRRPDSKSLIEDWKKTIEALPEATNVQFSDCTRMAPFAFISEHDHQSTGYPYQTWHICVQLHVDPKDKSGVKSKAGKKRAAKAAAGK